MLNVDRTTVSNWERGEKKPSIDILIKLRSIYGLTKDEVVGLKNDNPKSDINLCSYIRSCCQIAL
ncbi:MAG TPA: hypothetical protein DEF36_05375 [Desulfotomaculum sp.]|nr:hypothetical protein [Desulfotomaculum sp.]